MINRNDLLELVYRYYPRGIRHYMESYQPPDEPVYGDTSEHVRLKEAARRAQNESLYLLSGGPDPAYSARIWLANDVALSFHVSLLGPYYGIHLPGIPEEEPVAREVAREIEATYPGYQQIPPEIGNQIAPEVDYGCEFGKATIYWCLFSEVWTWIQPADVQREVHRNASK
jgi:hypothetical protein